MENGGGHYSVDDELESMEEERTASTLTSNRCPAIGFEKELKYSAACGEPATDVC
jgi:hypothetical protein